MIMSTVKIRNDDSNVFTDEPIDHKDMMPSLKVGTSLLLTDLQIFFPRFEEKPDSSGLQDERRIWEWRQVICLSLAESSEKRMPTLVHPLFQLIIQFLFDDLDVSRRSICEVMSRTKIDWSLTLSCMMRHSFSCWLTWHVIHVCQRQLSFSISRCRSHRKIKLYVFRMNCMRAVSFEREPVVWTCVWRHEGDDLHLKCFSWAVATFWPFNQTTSCKAVLITWMYDITLDSLSGKSGEESYWQTKWIQLIVDHKWRRQVKKKKTGWGLSWKWNLFLSSHQPKSLLDLLLFPFVKKRRQIEKMMMILLRGNCMKTTTSACFAWCHESSRRSKMNEAQGDLETTIRIKFSSLSFFSNLTFLTLQLKTEVNLAKQLLCM